jgi:hypothetical protein
MALRGAERKRRPFCHVLNKTDGRSPISSDVPQDDIVVWQNRFCGTPAVAFIALGRLALRRSDGGGGAVQGTLLFLRLTKATSQRIGAVRALERRAAQKEKERRLN